MIFRILVLAAVLWTAGCSPFQKSCRMAENSGARVIEGVPFRAQERRDDCGPAALASLLAFRGKDLPVADIAREVYSPALGGTLLPDLENFARRQGLEARSGRGDLALLRQRIVAGQPVAILVQTGFWVVSRPHYLVVFGFDDRGFLVHDGRDESVFIGTDELQDRWDKMNRLYLYLE